MVSIIADLEKVAVFAAGDRVRSMRGTMRGVVLRVMDDGRLAIRADGSKTELFALPESVCRDE